MLAPILLNPLLPRVAPTSDADKPAVRQANDNPWYCLATLYGELSDANLNTELRTKNRMAWNRWIAGALSDEQRAELVKKGFPEPELAPLSPDEKSAFYRAFASRTSRENGLPPEPADGVDFSRTHFDRKFVDFDGFLFVGGAVTFFVNFGAAAFSGRANFRGAAFFGYANFGLATFSGYADFDFARFSDTANFYTATFSGSASFYAATFSGSANFEAATFVHDVSFGSATFSGEAHFVDAKCAAARTSFAGAHFKTRVPDFRGATMHEATEWHGVSWPKPPRDKDAAQTQIYAYERLKQEMERLKKHEDEQQFFRRELRARRGLVPILSSNWLLNAIYQASSDYGNSFTRPLLWLLGVFAAGIAIFTQVPLCAGRSMPLKLATRFSFANIFIFLNDKRELMAMPDMAACLSNTTAAVSAAQSVSGVVLLFLLVLALRNRFRMRGSS
jgi:Pentapeptide repeats (9 copies)